MAGNEEHPFASIVAAYHESQATTPDKEEAAAEVSPADWAPAAVSPVEEPPAESVAEPSSNAESAAAEEPLTPPEPVSTPDVAAPAQPVVDEVAAAEFETPQGESAGSAEAETVAETQPGESLPEAAPVVPVAATAQTPEAEKPSALVDPFKSILAAYYAESVDAVPTPKAEPQAQLPTPPVAAEPVAAEPDAVEPDAVEPVPAEPVAAEVVEPQPELQPEPPAAEPEPVQIPEAPAAVVEPPAEEPAAVVESAPPAPPASPEPGSAAQPENAPETGPWGRHTVSAGAAGAAASVLAAYYADSPETPEAGGSPDESVVEAPAATAPATAEPTAAEPSTAAADTTLVLPAATEASFLDSPSNPLGHHPTSAGWGEQALAAAGSTRSTSPIEPANIEPVNELLPAAVQHRATEFIDAPAEDKNDQERSEAHRKFLMLAPIGAIAALAVLAVLLWNGNKSTPKPSPAPTTTPTIILSGSPMKQSQEAYASVLTRFSKANDAGAAVLAGGAAHDTLKLLRDFKGASARDKALLAAERTHLTSLSDLASTSPGSFGQVAGDAKHALAGVQKTAAADPTAGAPNGSAATAQAIDLLGEGNVSKLQVSLNSLIARADSASLTAQLRGVASDAAGNADAANSIASAIKNPSVQTTATTLANKFAALAPMARLSGDNLSDWSNIRPGMASTLGPDPVTHIDSLIANAKRVLADWQAKQGNNADTQAINAYASAMRSHFGSFGGALSQIPSLNPNETCAAGARDGTRSRAGNALVAVNNAANGFRGIYAPAALAGADAALHNAINTGPAAASAAQNVTVLCGTGTYGASGSWGTYSSNIWIKGGWGGKTGDWEAAVAAALKNASSAGPKPVV